MSFNPNRRHALIAWLYAASVAHLMVSLLLTWAGPTGLLDPYAAHIEHAFWDVAAPAAARAQQLWWLGLFGATLQSYSLYMLALVHIGSRHRIAAVWAWMMAGIMLWAPQDVWISVQAGVWSHAWIDSVALITLMPPLLWLYLHDRRAAVTQPIEPRTS